MSSMFGPSRIKDGRKEIVDYKAASEQLRAFAKSLAEAPDGADEKQGETVDRAIAKALQFASYDAIRDEFQHFVEANPELKLHVAIGKELMRENGYGDLDPICGLPGVKPMIAKIDDKEAVCFDASMSNVAPLSAIFANKVKEVLDAAAKVEAAEKGNADESGAVGLARPPDAGV